MFEAKYSGMVSRASGVEVSIRFYDTVVRETITNPFGIEFDLYDRTLLATETLFLAPTSTKENVDSAVRARMSELILDMSLPYSEGDIVV